MKSSPLLMGKKRRMSLISFAIGILSLVPSLAMAYNEDEWYDPTDWFDGNNIEADDTYDYSPYDYGYRYGFNDNYDYGTDWSRYDRWGDDVWGPGYYDANYWNNYDWSDSTSSKTSSAANANSKQRSSKSTAGTNQQKQNSQSGQTDDQDQAEVYTFTIFALPVADGSQDSGAKDSKPRAGNQARSSTSEGKGASEVARLDGTIQGLSQVRLKQASGATGMYTLANIEMDDGKSTVVNLGRSSQLRGLNLKKGASIQAVGRRGAIAGKTVFVAQKLKANGQTIDANPVIRLAQNQTAKNQKEVKGTVATMSESSGSKKDHTIVNLKLENGKTAMIDLGPAASLDKIGLDEGDHITVRGHTEQQNGRDVIVPNLMKIDGERVASVSQ